MPQQPIISPLDLAILLKIVTYVDKPWLQTGMAKELCISQSEVSKSLVRSRYAGLLDASGKKVRRMALMELLQHGIAYVFPQQPGALVRGVPTAHSAPPLNKIINSSEDYVWPSAKGQLRGQSIVPLYPKAVEAALNDPKLYELLSLVDAIRVGKAREKELAAKALQEKIVDGK